MLHHEPKGKQDSTPTPQKPIGRRTGHGIKETILDRGVSHAGVGEGASVATGKQLSASISSLSRGYGWGRTSYSQGTGCLPQAHMLEHFSQLGELHWKKVLEPLRKLNLAGGSECLGTGFEAL